MRIAFHVDQLSAKVPGGIGTYIRELVPALAALPNTDLVLFHCKGEGAGVPSAWRSDFSVTELPQSSRSLYLRWDLMGSPRLPGALGSADIVHAPLPVAVPAANTKGGQRLVVTVHDLAFEAFPETFPQKWRWLYRRGLTAAVRRAHVIITPSQATADDLARHSDRAGAGVVVIPEAASLPGSTADPVEVTARLGVASPYILAVGTVEPRKNLVTLIRAYRKILERNDLPTSLVIAGPDGWHAEAVHNEAETSSGGNIVFTGRLDASDLDGLYRGAWCSAYLSSFEGFGLPVLEAMARGIPLVASDTSSIPEVAGDAAMLVDPHDVTAVAEALELVLISEGAAARLSAAGLRRAAEFSWQRAAAETRAAYEGSLATNPS